jgi:hypothetical protein
MLNLQHGLYQACFHEVPAYIQGLLPAGGGAGGAAHGGGGGGAGGLIHIASYPVQQNQTYTVSVGAGGPPIFIRNGANGQDSTFGSSSTDTLRAIGGAGGLTQRDGTVTSGGSAGGQAACDYICPTSISTSGQGFPGGNGIAGYFAPFNGDGSGGGGGAGGPGGDATLCIAGAGGPGLAFDIETPGTDKWYAGGGGGYAGSDPYSTDCVYQGAGGIGGGGRGGLDNNLNVAAKAGEPDTGGGGGGTAWGSFGGAGGSGVVILRY